MHDKKLPNYFAQVGVCSALNIEIKPPSVYTPLKWEDIKEETLHPPQVAFYPSIFFFEPLLVTFRGFAQSSHLKRGSIERLIFKTHRCEEFFSTFHLVRKTFFSPEPHFQTES